MVQRKKISHHETKYSWYKSKESQLLIMMWQKKMNSRRGRWKEIYHFMFAYITGRSLGEMNDICFQPTVFEDIHTHRPQFVTCTIIDCIVIVSQLIDHVVSNSWSSDQWLVQEHYIDTTRIRGTKNYSHIFLCNTDIIYSLMIDVCDVLYKICTMICHIMVYVEYMIARLWSC